MWDETLIESGQHRARQKRWLSVPVSAVAHAIVVGIVIGVSYWSVEAVPPPQSRAPIWVVKVNFGPPPAPIDPAKFIRSQRFTPVISEIDPVAQQPVIQDMEPNAAGESAGEESGGGSGAIDGIQGGEKNGDGLRFGQEFTIAEEAPMVINTAMEQPVLIRKVTPVYPVVALRARIQGLVLLQAVISKKGTVEEVTLIRSAHPVLTKAAMDAVSQWGYRPALLQGRPVRVYFNVTVEFRIQ